METITRKGKTFVLVEEANYQRLLRGPGAEEAELPPLPPAMPGGLRPALPFVRAVIARQIIRERQALGWSQAELARRARVQPAVLNRIEKGRVTPEEATIDRIDRAMKIGAKKQGVR